MKRIYYLLFLIYLASLMIGCSSKQKAVTISGSRLYYVDVNETQILSEEYEPKATKTDELIQEYLIALDRTPEDLSLKKAKPEDVLINDYNYDEAGILTLYFNANYYNMSVITEILCRAVIVKTLCQIEGVDFVEFYVNGQPLILSDEVAGIMKSENFVDNTGEESSFIQEVNVTVYFTDKSGKWLHDSMLVVNYDGTKTLEQIVLEQLIFGPVEGESNLLPIIPFGTKIRKVTTSDGICYVDLNEGFLQKLPDVSAEVTIFGIVNSLVELTTVNKVQFKINGEIVDSYEGISFAEPFDRKLELIKNEKGGGK